MPRVTSCKIDARAVRTVVHDADASKLDTGASYPANDAARSSISLSWDMDGRHYSMSMSPTEAQRVRDCLTRYLTTIDERIADEKGAR